MKLKLLLLSILTFFLSLFPSLAFAQLDSPPPPVEERLNAIVLRVVEEKKVKLFDREQTFQKLELEFETGSKKGEKVIIDNGAIPAFNAQKYNQGDKVVIAHTNNPDGGNVYYIIDYNRTDALFWLFVVFCVLTLFISGRKGIFSLLSMAFTFLIIFTIIVPQIASGKNPVLVAVLASLIIVPVTFYLSHGFNKKTSIAVTATTISLLITGLLSTLFVNLTKLTGYASEEAGFLQSVKGGTFDIKGLLLAGIIIGTLGILDDVTITQSSVVEQLKKASKEFNFLHLYQKAMVVGRDHIASVVNTLVIVYTGAALPLLVLFVNNPAPFTEIINYEIISEEIVRTLVASIGLILSIPITTLLAAWIFSKQKA